jgi:hypothetical protein
MTHRIIEGAKEALAVARGEFPAARLTINGHAYVPEVSVDPDIRHVTELLEAIVKYTQVGNRTMNDMVSDMDRACDCARTALTILREPTP